MHMSVRSQKPLQSYVDITLHSPDKNGGCKILVIVGTSQSGSVF